MVETRPAPGAAPAASARSAEGMTRVLITAVPFGEADPGCLDLLAEAGVDWVRNPHGRRLTEPEIASLVADFDVVIAGTEPITRSVIRAGRRLRLVSRVGSGLDSVDLSAARDHGVAVAYTPEAPAAGSPTPQSGHGGASMRRTRRQQPSQTTPAVGRSSGSPQAAQRGAQATARIASSALATGGGPIARRATRRPARLPRPPPEARCGRRRPTGAPGRTAPGSRA